MRWKSSVTARSYREPSGLSMVPPLAKSHLWISCLIRVWARKCLVPYQNSEKTHFLSRKSWGVASYEDVLSSVDWAGYRDIWKKECRPKAWTGLCCRDWHELPAPVLTDELKRDLRLLRLRGAMDPKRFYKRAEKGKFPAKFAVGTVVEGPADFYSSEPYFFFWKSSYTVHIQIQKKSSKRDCCSCQRLVFKGALSAYQERNIRILKVWYQCECSSQSGLPFTKDPFQWVSEEVYANWQGRQLAILILRGEFHGFALSVWGLFQKQILRDRVGTRHKESSPGVKFLGTIWTDYKPWWIM